MEPDDEKTLTIARRSKTNLEYIYQKKHAGENVEEFTQLLNSMLGIIISLREDYFKNHQASWQEVEEMGLLKEREYLKLITGEIDHANPKLRQAASFSELIDRLRHGFAHNCFRLSIDESTRKIAGIQIWNVPTKTKNKYEEKEWIWKARFTEQELKQFAYLVIDYLEEKLK